MLSSKLFLFVHIKFDNIAKTDKFFSAFLHKEAICSSNLNSIQDGGRGAGGQKWPPTSFSPATSTNVGIGP